MIYHIFIYKSGCVLFFMEAWKERFKSTPLPWRRAIRYIAKQNGISLKEICQFIIKSVDNGGYLSGCLVRDRESELFGKIGLYEVGVGNDLEEYRFGNTLVEINVSNEEKYFCAKNLVMLMEESKELLDGGN